VEGDDREGRSGEVSLVATVSFSYLVSRAGDDVSVSEGKEVGRARWY
jgi:hypothetical protein